MANALKRVRDFLGAPKTNAGDPHQGKAARKENLNMFNIARTAPNGKGVGDVAPAVFSAASTPETKRGAAWLASRIERSKHFAKNELDTETVTITPVLAELMLMHNTDNRPIRPAKVKKMADAITGGWWKLTSQGISFSRGGVLNDGQHRLAAIVAAGRAVDCRVTFGEDTDVFDVLDTGAARNGGDALAIAGYKYWALLAAGTRLYLNVTSNAPLANTSVSNDRILATVEAEPTLADVCVDADRVYRHLRAPKAPLVAAFHLIKSRSKAAGGYDAFIEGLCEGANLRKRDAVLTLRNMLATGGFNEARSNTARGARLCAGVILGWNKYVEGRAASERQLRWNIETPFPIAE